MSGHAALTWPTATRRALGVIERRLYDCRSYYGVVPLARMLEIRDALMYEVPTDEEIGFLLHDGDGRLYEQTMALARRYPRLWAILEAL